MQTILTRLMATRFLVVAFLPLSTSHALAGDDVFVRFQLLAPADAPWFVKVGGYIHNDPWHLPDAKWPKDADKNLSKRVAPGEFSAWFDLGAHAGKRLHGRLNRAGGIAEFPNVTLEFVGGGTNPAYRVVIELATAPEDAAVVKRMEESFQGNKTSFLVSSALRADAESLETASQMTARHLAWARAASGGRRASPTNLWVQTQFWAAQRPELDLQEAEAVWLLGFNLVGNTTDNMVEAFPFLRPAGHHWTEFGPALTREEIEQQIAGPAAKARKPIILRPEHDGVGEASASASELAFPRTLFGFSDEIACRPPIGTNANALFHFRSW